MSAILLPHVNSSGKENDEMQKKLIGLLLAVFLAACSQNRDDDREPTVVEPTVMSSATASPSPTATLNVTPTNTLEGVTPTLGDSPTPGATSTLRATFPPTLTPSFTPSPAPPTGSPTPTATPGPFEHSIRQGDDCISIVYQYGHVDLDVLQMFYSLNNMQGCSLPGAGNVVFVPRPTAISVVVDPNASPLPTYNPAIGDPSQYVAIGQYCVVDDDTLTSIALKNDTTLRRICEMNPLPNGLDCSGCDFSQTDVGFCPRPPVVSIGQCLNVPGSTPTPTATASPSGNETPTPTPTHRAPNVVAPQNGVTVNGTVLLQWVSIGRLSQNEYYVVQAIDETTGKTFNDSTRSTSIMLPSDFLAADGQSHSIVWSVSVQVLNEQGLFIPIGGRTSDYRFTWE